MLGLLATMVLTGCRQHVLSHMTAWDLIHIASNHCTPELLSLQEPEEAYDRISALCKTLFNVSTALARGTTPGGTSSCCCSPAWRGSSSSCCYCCCSPAWGAWF